MVLIEDGGGAAAVGQRGEVTPLALLAEQLVDKGLVNAKGPSDVAFGGEASLDRVNNPFPEV
jgi:hypothetical protein